MVFSDELKALILRIASRAPGRRIRLSAINKLVKESNNIEVRELIRVIAATLEREGKLTLDKED